MRPAFLFDACRVRRLDADAPARGSRRSPRSTPTSTRCSTSTSPRDYEAARARPRRRSPSAASASLRRLAGAAATRRSSRAATLGEAAAATGLTLDEHVVAALNGDQITRDPRRRSSPATRWRSSPRTPAADRVRTLGRMAPPGGYFGRALVVDVTDARAEVLPLPDDVLRALRRRRRPRRVAHARARAAGRRSARPRGAARLLLLAARRHAADHERQVRRRRQVAADRAAQRRPRVVPLRDRGQADRRRRHRRSRRGLPEPSVLLVDGDGARLEPAGDLWGLPAAEAESRLRETGSGRPGASPPIGPAGERLVRYATISHDGRHAGRGGLGRGPRLEAASRRSRSGPRRRSRRPTRRPCSPPRGPARALVRSGDREVPRARHGREPAGLQPIATLPTRNFQAATFEAPRARRRGPRRCPRRRARLAARPAPSAASTSTRGRRQEGAASSTRTSSRSARCAASPIPTPCSRPAPAATSSGSTRSPPAARSPSPWSAPSAA